MESNEDEMASLPSIGDFYKDRSVLVTGATGILGKVIVEKLLRSCPSIARIYLLCRPKNQRNVQQRFEEFGKLQLFDRLLKEQPNALNKLTAIHGDVTHNALGLAGSDVEILTRHVTVVFHCAASVRFDETLKEAMKMNVAGTKHVIQFCRTVRNLVALIHVSTAYSFCGHSKIEEMIYTTNVDPRGILETIEWMDDSTTEAITPHLLKDHPNTYTFTKGLAEKFLGTHASDLPVAIVRPSMITSSWKEPTPGWIDGHNAILFTALAIAKGALRTMYGHSDMHVDLIPVDVTANLVISAAWYTATQSPNKILVFNNTTGNIKPLTWNDALKIIVNTYVKYPVNQVLWVPSLELVSSKQWYTILDVIYHDMPAFCGDLINRIRGRKLYYQRMRRKVKKLSKLSEWFLNNQLNFVNDNQFSMTRAMNKEDSEIFSFDTSTINWETYLENFCLGLKVHVLKEDASTLPNAKRTLQIMNIIRHCGHIVGFFFLWKLLMYNVETIQLILRTLLNQGDHITRVLSQYW